MAKSRSELGQHAILVGMANDNNPFENLRQQITDGMPVSKMILDQLEGFADRGERVPDETMSALLLSGVIELERRIIAIERRHAEKDREAQITAAELRSQFP